MLTLKTALLVNGISAGATGAGLIAFARSIAVLFGLDQVAPFLYSGVFLILFGLYVVKTALSKSIGFPALRLISSLDLLWIIASIAVVAAAGSVISIIGNILIIAVAAWVGLMAVLQERTRKQEGVLNRV